MQFKRHRIVGGLAAAVWLLVAACTGEQDVQLSGQTMGTTYHVKVTAGRSFDRATLEKKMALLLEQISQSMSTYRPTSEISRFNAMRQTLKPFPISGHFLRVMLVAREIFELTGGAWDGTVDPLVNLWGFGRGGALKQIPDPRRISQDLARVGFDRIQIDVSGFLIKKHPDITLDLASIAKGYAVDQVALLLKQQGFDNYLVEIGGEVYAAGTRPDGKAWRVGINQPAKDAAADAVYKVVSLQDQAMATSGDYRNFYEIEGASYSHIIDPRTGYPVKNGVVSASVIADNCGLADGLATALIVMGPQKGIALLNRLGGIEGVVVVRLPNGDLKPYWSQGMVIAGQ